MQEIIECHTDASYSKHASKKMTHQKKISEMKNKRFLLW